MAGTGRRAGFRSRWDASPLEVRPLSPAQCSSRNRDPRWRIPIAADPAFGGQIPEAASVVAGESPHRGGVPVGLCLNGRHGPGGGARREPRPPHGRRVAPRARARGRARRRRSRRRPSRSRASARARCRGRCSSPTSGGRPPLGGGGRVAHRRRGAPARQACLAEARILTAPRDRRRGARPRARARGATRQTRTRQTRVPPSSSPAPGQEKPARLLGAEFSPATTEAACCARPKAGSAAIGIRHRGSRFREEHCAGGRGRTSKGLACHRRGEPGASAGSRHARAAGTISRPSGSPTRLPYRVDDQTGERDERKRRERDEHWLAWRTSSAQNAPTTTQAVAIGRQVVAPSTSPARNTTPKTTIPTAIARSVKNGPRTGPDPPRHVMGGGRGPTVPRGPAGRATRTWGRSGCRPQRSTP